MSLEEDLMRILLKYARAEWDYISPNFLLAITENLETYFNLENEEVYEWIADMWGA